MIRGARSTWIAARARNAARRRVGVLLVATVAVLATGITLVLVPRTLDRQVRVRIAALPDVPDSLPFMQRLEAVRKQLRLAQQERQRDSVASTADSSRPVVDTSGVFAAPSTPTAIASAITSAIAADTSALDLAARLSRVKSARLVDRYRTLTDAPMLRDDAKVRALRDSIDAIDRERDAHAALGGPGARYAALTARLTAIGQRLVSVAEQHLAHAVFASAANAATRATAATMDSVRREALDSLVRVLNTQRVREESSLVFVRQQAVARDSARVTLERTLTMVMPPAAIVLSALVVGLACGFAVMFVRELRCPTVGDAAEIEQVTAAPVFLYATSVATPDVARVVGRDRPGIPAIIDRESDVFVLLHLALTGVGDVVARAEVLADEPMIGAAVALGIAAVAARESRMPLIVETGRDRSVLNGLVAPAARSTIAEENVRVIMLDRDAHIDLLPFDVASVFPDVADRYDLQLMLSDTDDVAISDARDVIICTRQGVTSLVWLRRATGRARSRQQRVRAVVLWQRAVPPIPVVGKTSRPA